MSGAHLLPSYGHVDSPLRRAPAGAKLGATLLFVSALALVPVRHVVWTIPPLALVVALTRVARIPLAAFVARVAIAEPFVLGVAVLSLFQGGGLAIFAAIVLKSTTCVAAVQLMAHTTAFRDVLAVLARAGVPAALVWTLALLQRYLFVLVDETRRMQRARAARTWRGGRLAFWKAQASVVAVSFVRSVARAERIYAAMLARGWS
jgi:cobalt/nickel transport system permease protein